MPTTMLGLAVLAALLLGAPAQALEARVAVRQGVPTLLVNGKPLPPMMLFNTAGGGPTPLVCKLTPQWQQFSYTFRAPEDDDNVGCHIRNIQPAGDWFVDDSRLVEGTLDKPLSDNLLKGGDFEGEQPPGGWTYFLNNSTGAAVEWSHVAGEARDGNKCLRVRIIHPGTISYEIHLFQRFAIKSGKTYTFSVWLKSPEPREVEINALHQGPPWTTYGGASGKSEELLRLGAARGLHMGNPPLPVVWTQPGKAPDFSGLDAMVEQILEADPEALIIPRLNLDAPAWWTTAYPDQIQVYDVGTQVKVSPASPRWRKDAADALRQTIRHLEGKYGEHMLGYHPCAQSAGEWFYDRVWEKIMPNFEEPFRAAFAAWAKHKYGTEAALRQAWQQPEVTFETIRVPTMEERTTGLLGAFRDPARQRFPIDFSEYMQVCLSDYLMECARIVKEETGRRKISVFFYGYHYELSGFTYGAQVTGHFRLHEVLHCPDVDVLVSPISYADRGSDGAGSFMSPVDSIQLHGKLWLNEDDTRTHLSPADSGYGRTGTMAQTLGVYRRNFGHQLERHCATWWMDFGTGWMADPTIFDNFAHERDIWLQKPAKGAFSPPVAMITDEASNLYLRNSAEITACTVSLMRQRFNAMGCPVGLYLLDDLCEGKLPASARLYVFLNDFRLTAAQRKQVRAQVARDGKVALWLYAPGYVADDGPAAENIAATIGFKVEQLNDPGSTRIGMLPRLEDWPPGTPGGQAFGDDRRVSPRFVVPAQPGVTPLGVYGDTQRVGLAVKKAANWTSVFCGALDVSPYLLQGLARVAGAHIYSEGNDVISACPGFVSIHATSAGPKALLLPRRVTPTDLITGEKLKGPTDQIELHMESGETRLFGW